MRPLRVGQHVKVVYLSVDDPDDMRAYMRRFAGKRGRVTMVLAPESDGVMVRFKDGTGDLFWPEEVARRRRGSR